jgi:hypothetical protein
MAIRVVPTLPWRVKMDHLPGRRVKRDHRISTTTAL